MKTTSKIHGMLRTMKSTKIRSLCPYGSNNIHNILFLLNLPTGLSCMLNFGITWAAQDVID